VERSRLPLGAEGPIARRWKAASKPEVEGMVEQAF
jgi:hypothetical protein